MGRKLGEMARRAFSDLDHSQCASSKLLCSPYLKIPQDNSSFLAFRGCSLEMSSPRKTLSASAVLLGRDFGQVRGRQQGDPHHQLFRPAGAGAFKAHVVGLM